MDNLNVNECLLVSVDFSHGEDTGVLIVGRQKEGKTAIDIYKQLITVKEVRL